jgi:gliding motility-associated-like protein
LYAVTGTDANGCKNNDNVVVTVNPLPPVDAGLDFTMYKGVCLDLLAMGATSYLWSPAMHVSDPTIASPQFCATTIDTITLYLLGTDNNGCQSLDSITINIIGVPDITVPTGFTPDGNGVNDEFRIMKSHNFHLVKLQVFNRWGQNVFESGDINHGWDGTFGGIDQPLGTYVYVVHGHDEYGVAVVKEGNVTLIR